MAAERFNKQQRRGSMDRQHVVSAKPRSRQAPDRLPLPAPADDKKPDPELMLPPAVDRIECKADNRTENAGAARAHVGGELRDHLARHAPVEPGPKPNPWAFRCCGSDSRRRSVQWKGRRQQECRARAGLLAIRTPPAFSVNGGAAQTLLLCAHVVVYKPCWVSKNMQTTGSSHWTRSCR